jgi:hypothetical protein
MKLYFQNSRKQERLIAECATLEEVHCEIKKFLHEHNFKSYYTRVLPDRENSNRVILDVGSWSEFMIIEGITFEAYCEKVKNDNR